MKTIEVPCYDGDHTYWTETVLIDRVVSWHSSALGRVYDGVQLNLTDRELFLTETKVSFESRLAEIYDREP